MQQIGGYQIAKETGRGGMSTVYEAFDPHFKRAVAVKVMTRELLDDPKLKARFEREAQTIAALEHPAIVPVYDFGEDENRPYLVMRLMTGGTLSERLSAGPLSISESARILKRIGSALERAHAEGVIHRDLKPSNIMFDQYGDAFLADFGIARLTEGALNLTGENVIGTPAYMSPEQIHGDQTIDGRSDIYALGVICFEMLTGRRPFEEKTAAKIMMQHLIDPVPDIREIRPDLPQGVKELISRSMAKSPAERYSDAHEMTDTLDSLAQIAPLSPTPRAVDGSEQAAAVAAASQISETPAAVSAVELTIPDSSEMSGQKSMAEPPPPSAGPAVEIKREEVVSENGRSRRGVVVIAAVIIVALILVAAFIFRNQFLPAGEEPPAVVVPTRVEEDPTAAEAEPENEADPDVQPLVDAQMERFYAAMDAEAYDTAVEAIQEAINLAPDQAWLYSEKAWVLETIGEEDQAIHALEEAIALEPDYGDFYSSLGTLYREQGDLDHALELHQRGLELNPDSPSVQIELAGTFKALNNPEMALEHYNEAVALQDDQAWFYEERADLFFQLGEYDQGLTDLEHAAELDPDQRSYFTQAGFIFLYDLEEPQRALEYFSRAVERAPEDPGVYADRALAFSSLGRGPEALADLNHALELDPANGEFYIRRSQVHRYDLNDVDAALADLNHAVELDPQNPDFYAQRGDFFQYQVGDLEAALADRDKAVALELTGPWRYADRGLVYREMGRDEEALANFDQCLALDAEYYWCHWERAWVYDNLDQKAEAVADLQHYLEQAPADDCPECHEEAERYILENE